MHLAQDRDQWRTPFEHSNEPLGSIKGGGISWLAEWLSASQEGLYAMELVSYSIRCNRHDTKMFVFSTYVLWFPRDVVTFLDSWSYRCSSAERWAWSMSSPVGLYQMYVAVCNWNEIVIMKHGRKVTQKWLQISRPQ